MKTKLAIALALITGIASVSIAEPRESHRAHPLASRAYRAAQRISDTVQFMQPAQRASVERALSALETALQGSSFGNVCEEEDPQVMREALEKVRSTVYSSSSFNMSSSDANAFALKWGKTYPCRSADVYLANLKSIYDAAYSSSGMNMSSSDARAITAKWMDTTCELVADFGAKVREYYNYAYSSSGMNMSSSDARAYTINMMEKRYFHCQSEVYRY